MRKIVLRPPTAKGQLLSPGLEGEGDDILYRHPIGRSRPMNWSSRLQGKDAPVVNDRSTQSAELIGLSK